MSKSWQDLARNDWFLADQSKSMKINQYEQVLARVFPPASRPSPRTGDARKHAHALELFDLNVQFDEKKVHFISLSTRLLHLINLHEIDFPPPWRKPAFCHQHFTAPAASGFQATRRGHFKILECGRPKLTLLSKIGTLPFLPIYAGRLLHFF